MLTTLRKVEMRQNGQSIWIQGHQEVTCQLFWVYVHVRLSRFQGTGDSRDHNSDIFVGLQRSATLTASCRNKGRETWGVERGERVLLETMHAEQTRGTKEAR